MIVNKIRSDEIYKKIMTAPKDKKDDIYRYEMMKPFEKKWACYNVPLKAKLENGYDVIAENFATSIYGEEKLGQWVSKVDMDTLDNYIKPLIKDALDIQGMENLTSYLYGDEIATMQGYLPVGLPFCAGYACGYYMIKQS